MKTTQKTSYLKMQLNHKNSCKNYSYGMYVLLGMTVLSGLFIGCLFWLGIKNGFVLDTVITIHELVINLLYFFIGIHIFTATYHRFKKMEYGHQWCLF